MTLILPFSTILKNKQYLICMWVYLGMLNHSVVSDTCNPKDCSPPDSSVHGILQARILEGVAVSFSRGSSQPRNQTHIARIGWQILYCWATREALPFFRNVITGCLRKDGKMYIGRNIQIVVLVKHSSMPFGVWLLWQRSFLLNWMFTLKVL